MCGIVGKMSYKSISHEDDMLRMKNALTEIWYRGPDNQSIWMDDKVILGHRRLSIIDLSESANQPFHDENNKIHIVFNGEVYNYKEIRRDLEKKGIVFKTNSDTETIVYLYKLYGEDFVKYINGMFAIAIYDSENRKLILARDRLGKKPLYYFLNSEKILFASEVKSLKHFISLNINLVGLTEYFLLQHVKAPATIYENIYSVLPGEMITIPINYGSVKFNQYWDLKKISENVSTTFSLETLDQKLYESVQYRLIADVDIGLLLSGGVDSTLLACYVKEYGGSSIKTFNVQFSETKFDESNYAKLVAEKLGFKLYFERGDDVTEEIFLKSITHCDQPLGDPAIIPTYMISKQIAKHLKVVLSGEGADELFYGYDYYKYDKFSSVIKIINYFLSPLHKSEYVNSKNESKLLYRLKRLNELGNNYDISKWRTVFSLDELNSILVREKTNEQLYGENDIRSILNLNDSTSIDTSRGSLNEDLIDWLPNDLLFKVDRMTMANSIEARTPFLDYNLVEYLAGVEQQYLSSIRTSKKPLRKLLTQKLPGELGKIISNRKKHGFEVPMDEWLKTKIRGLTEKYFSINYLNEIAFLNAKYINKYWMTYLNSSRHSRYTRQIWVIFSFLAWYDIHCLKKNSPV